MRRNAGRIRDARRTLLTVDQGEPAETQITDVLTNLRHLAHVEGVDFADVIRKSKTHFEEELAEEA